MRENKEKRRAKDRTLTSTLELFRALILTISLSQSIYRQIKNGLVNFKTQRSRLEKIPIKQNLT